MRPQSYHCLRWAIALLMITSLSGGLGSGCASSRRTDELIAQILQEEAAANGAAASTAATGPATAPAESAPSSPAATTGTRIPGSPVAPSTPKAASVPPPAAPAEPVTPASINDSQPSEGGPVTVQPDSVLQITVEEDPSLTGRYAVNDFSAIDFGYVGLVTLHDMTVEQVAAKIRSVLESRYLRKATVKVGMAKASYDKIEISGEVMRPGTMKIGPGSSITLREALLRAGGLRPQATSARVKIVREGMLSPFKISDKGETMALVDDRGRPNIPQVFLQNNDLIHVFSYEGKAIGPMGEKYILLLGEVKSPGVIRFSSEEPCTLMYLLFKIGGLPAFAKGDAIRIVRRDKNGVETEILGNADVLMKEGRTEDDVALENGDKIIVPARHLSIF